MEEFSLQDPASEQEVPPGELAAEIRAGNRQAETLFYTRYQAGLVLMLERRTRDRARAEDLAQDTLITVLTRLRGDGIDDPERLTSYVHQTAKYKFIGWLRKMDNRNELIPSADDREADAGTIEEDFERERLRERVRTLIGEMKVARDRELLYRYYVRDQAKAVVCEALDLSSSHFDRVINRARKRFKELMLRRSE